MKRNKKFFALVSLLLICVISANFYGCTSAQAADLMEGITPNEITATGDISQGNAAVADFAVRLLRASNKTGENTLISPLSVLCALAMTANGAKGETLEQMEKVLGMTTEELNLYLYSYMNSLTQGEKYKLSLANSIWFTDHERFEVNQDFLQTNADYYGADIYKAPFNNSTLKDINDWVKERTDDMIPNILDEIPDEAVMYLVNALAFEAEWSEIYYKNQVRDGQFTKEDGTKQNAEFMYGSEGKYLEDKNAIGFIKYYKDCEYAFVAMLPNEGVSVSEYIASLDGESLRALLANKQRATVNTAIPKFETEYNVEMSEILSAMGMQDAFRLEKADFTAIGASSAGNIYINRVLHKTFISVGEKGTKAGAASAVEMNDECAADVTDSKQVYLDRPFVYMLIDCKNDIPFFIGTMMDIQK